MDQLFTLICTYVTEKCSTLISRMIRMKNRNDFVINRVKGDMSTLISQSDVKAMKKIVASQINWSKVSQDNPDNAQ